MEYVKRKCLSALAILYKAKSALPSCLKKYLYRSLIQPHLGYCSAEWAECCKEDAVKLEKEQNSGMMFIYSTKLGTVLEYKTRLDASCGEKESARNYIPKEMHDRGGPNYMRNMIKTNSEAGLHSTRRSKDIYLPHMKSSWLGKSFLFKTSHDWNQIPVSIREAKDVTFMKYLKQYHTN